MQATRILRALVITEFVLLVASILLVFLPDETPEAVNDYLNGPGAGPILRLVDSESTTAAIVVGALTAIITVTYLVCLIGLLRLKPWARSLYVVLFVAGVCIYPFLGSSLVDPVSGAMEYLAAVCTGAVLVILFLSDVRTHFERAPNKSLEQTREG